MGVPLALLASLIRTYLPVCTFFRAKSPLMLLVTGCVLPGSCARDRMVIAIRSFFIQIIFRYLKFRKMPGRDHLTHSCLQPANGFKSTHDGISLSLTRL